MGSSGSVRSWNIQPQKILIAKTQMDFLLDIFSAFVLCWMWGWRVTSSGRGRVSMTNVVSNERSFGRQWPDYNSLFHFTSSTINTKQRRCCFPQPKGLVFVCLWNSNVKMAAHYANVDTIITFQQKVHNSVSYLNSLSYEIQIAIDLLTKQSPLFIVFREKNHIRNCLDVLTKICVNSTITQLIAFLVFFLKRK